MAACTDSCRSSPDTTASSSGVFRNDSLRVPKWYTSAPNGSGRRETCGLQRNARSGSNAGPAARAGPAPVDSGSVDTAHAVDRDLLDQGLLDDGFLGRGVVLCGSHRQLLSSAARALPTLC